MSLLLKSALHNFEHYGHFYKEEDQIVEKILRYEEKASEIILFSSCGEWDYAWQPDDRMAAALFAALRRKGYSIRIEIECHCNLEKRVCFADRFGIPVIARGTWAESAISDEGRFQQYHHVVAEKRQGEIFFKLPQSRLF